MKTSKATADRQGPLAKAADLRDRRAPRLAALTAFVLCAMIVGLVVLAAITPVPQITRASGTILPNGSFQEIQSLDGGIVVDVHVTDGQYVTEGTVLVELRHPDLDREMDVLTADLMQIDHRLQNALAVLDTLNRDEEFPATTLEELRRQGLNFAADQLQIHFESQRIRLASIRQQEATLTMLAAAAELSAERVARKSDQLKVSEGLKDRGIKTVSDYLDEVDQLDVLRTAASEAQVRVAEAQRELDNSISDMVSESLGLRQKHLDLAETMRQERQKMDVAARALQSRVSSLNIVAPQKGFVQSVSHPNPGEVIAPGALLFELMPSQEALMVEARIPGMDIGHVDFVHPVTIGVDTFDERRFGKVSGTLKAVSPVPVVDDATQEQYFRASIALASETIGTGAAERPLQAGMSVMAEFRTGEDTLLAYFFKPLRLTLANAFSER